jgi:hypothetical protein
LFFFNAYCIIVVYETRSGWTTNLKPWLITPSHSHPAGAKEEYNSYLIPDTQLERRDFGVGSGRGRMSRKELRAAGILIFRLVSRRTEYLLLQASNLNHHWTPPKGRQ